MKTNPYEEEIDVDVQTSEMKASFTNVRLIQKDTRPDTPL